MKIRKADLLVMRPLSGPRLTDDGILTLDLPWPPSVNHYWRMWRGRMVTSAAGRTYQQAVASILRGYGVEPFAGDVCVAAELRPPDRRRRDVDNSYKAPLDAMTRGRVYHDDSQIFGLYWWRGPVERGGRIIVAVYPGAIPHCSPVELLRRLIPTQDPSQGVERAKSNANARNGHP